MKRLLFSAVLLLLASVCAWGQGAAVVFPPVTNTQGLPIPQALITFCSMPATFDASGNCLTTVTVYQDETLVTPWGSAIQTDGLGNFPPNYLSASPLWFTPGQYCFTVTATTIVHTVNKCTPFSVPVVSGGSPSFLNLTVTGNETVGGTLGVTGAATLGALSVSSRTRDCRQDGTIDLTGATDSSAVINTCITGAVANNQGIIQLPCGTYLFNSAINDTNAPGLTFDFCSFNTSTLSNSPPGVAASKLLCNSGTVCWDMTGSASTTIRNANFILAGTGVSIPTPVGILMGRDNAGIGSKFCFSENDLLENVGIFDYTAGGLNTAANGGRGYIGIYNYGAETGVLRNFEIFTATPVVFTNSNVATISSPYQTIGTGCTVTMTGFKLDTGTLTSNSATAPTTPSIEADGTANMDVATTTFIGGNCGIKFEGSYNSNSWAEKWHVIGNQESTLTPASFICGTVPVRDSFFHVSAPGPTAFISPGANNLSYDNNTFLFNNDLGTVPLITNTATGTFLRGGYASVSNATSMSNTTVVGTFINAPGLTTAQVNGLFAAASSGFYASTSSGAGLLGINTVTTLRQLDASTNFIIRDAAGNNHIFMTNGQNTFIQGDGTHKTIVGAGANVTTILDGTGLPDTIGGVTSADRGWPAIYGTPQHLTAQTANLAATNVYASAPAGTYRVCFDAFTTTSGTGTTATVSILWTDSGGAKTFTSGTWALNSVTVTGYVDGCKVIHVASGNIQVSTSGTFGTSAYALDAWAEREN